MCFSLSVSFARSLGSLIDQAARERARAHNERARADCPRGGLIPRTPAREPGARFFEDVSFVHVWACVCVREASLERETARGMEIWMGDGERERGNFFILRRFLTPRVRLIGFFGLQSCAECPIVYQFFRVTCTSNF